MSSETSSAAPAKMDSKGALQANVLSGFLVFLIALPLCLGIASASKYPPIMGIWTAVLGGIICTFLSNSAMTIKGPAAGMIVIVSGAVVGFQLELMAENPSMADKDALYEGYRLALGVGVVSGVIQILMGLLRAGVLTELFPISAVHGLLASIGVIIILKQAYPLLGFPKAPDGEAIESLKQLPGKIGDLVPNVAAIGIPCLIILFALPFINSKVLKKIPAQVIVLILAIPMGLILGVDKKFLVPIVSPLENIKTAFVFPNFERVFTRTGIYWLAMFAMIGSLESLLAAKAIDLVDPKKRKTNLNRDLFAVGIANTIGSLIGALPMISEIVRSKANIDNGAQSRFSNLFHGLFLLLAVLFLADGLAHIPLAALGAMLIFTGYRLAHPREFAKTFKIGPEQLAIFVTTIVVVLFTDLLIGIAAGLAVKLLALFIHGITPAAMVTLKSTLETRSDGTPVLHVTGPIVFLNWVRLKSRIDALDAKTVVVNVSKASFIDHTVVERFHELEMQFKNAGRHLDLEQFHELDPISSHQLSARKMKRPSGVIDPPPG